EGGEVLGGPFLDDLAVVQAVEVGRVPAHRSPGGGDAQQRPGLRAGHDQADHDLVALAEDVLHGGVQVGYRGHHGGHQAGDVVAPGDRADRAAVPLHVRGQVLRRV